jgi:hypothetical protein
MATPRKHPPAVSVELNIEQLTLAIERERVRRQLRHYQVAAELGVSETTVACWRRGGGMNGDVAVRIAVWLRRDLRSFARQKPAADLDPAIPADAA